MKTTASTEIAGKPYADGRSRGRGRAVRHFHTLITIRQATPEDCARISRLFMIASDGIAEYIWSRVEAPGLSLLEIGERRYARRGTAFSYQNCLVAEKDGAVVGMVHSFPMREPAARNTSEHTSAPLSGSPVRWTHIV